MADVTEQYPDIASKYGKDTLAYHNAVARQKIVDAAKGAVKMFTPSSSTDNTETQ